jgi:carbamoyltransferase
MGRRSIRAERVGRLDGRPFCAEIVHPPEGGLDMNANILGLSAYYHDSAACLVTGSGIVAAAQEERFTRRKHDHEFPARAAAYCLREGGLSVPDLDYVVFYDKPFLKFERLLQSYLHIAPSGLPSFLAAMPLWLKKKLWMSEDIADQLGFDGRILFTEHHESHAASAFFPSPFERAAILTIDGVGEWATASLGTGDGNRIRVLEELHFPHSLGLLYSAFTYFTGFKVNSGEYKLMGLAPYGEPRYVERILEHLVDLKDDGSLKLNMAYFDFVGGLRMTNAAFHRLFDGPPRRAESPLTRREMDLAASVQAVTELAMLNMARYAHRKTGLENLCLAGGVALNCVGNGRILREGPFRSLWIQPAAGDAGGALGAALFVHHQLLGAPRSPVPGRDSQRGSLLGPAFSSDDIGAFIADQGIKAERFDDPESLVGRVVDALRAEAVVGWFQGRMEFGPRALGARSILGDARSRTMQTTMNLKIKFRESFRPFAPSVLRERVGEWFDMQVDSPYMLLVANVAQARRLSIPPGNAEGLEKLRQIRSSIPAVTHVDNSARVQTVDEVEHPLYHRLLRRFEEATGCPVLVNTSFNVRGEPIVGTPADAYRCFTRTEMDLLVLGPFVIDRKDQNLPPVDDAWKNEFALD